MMNVLLNNILMLSTVFITLYKIYYVITAASIKIKAAGQYQNDTILIFIDFLF